MIVYISALLLSLGLVRITKKYKINTRDDNLTVNLGVFVAIIPFWVVSCLRYNVGTDYETYVGFYSTSIPEGSYKSDFLFSFLIKLCVNIFHNEYLIIWILATIFLSLMIKSIYKYSDNIKFAVLLFFLSVTFSLSLNIMKQMVATAIWIYSLDFIKHKKVVWYAAFLVLAVGFHKVAAIYSIAYFLYSKQFSVKKAWPILLLTVYMFSGRIRNILVFICQKLNFYYGYFYNRYDNHNRSITLLIINIVCLGLLAYVIDKSRENEKKKSLYFYYNIQLICTVCAVIMPIIPNADRIVYLFIPLQIISVPNSINMINGRLKRKIISIFIIILYMGMFYKLFVSGNMGETLPYRWLKFF